MAQRLIRELFGKRLLYHFLSEYLPKSNYKYPGFLITPENISNISFPEFTQGYVVKPDELFGKRGKNNLIFINKNPQKIKDWITKKMRGEVTVYRNKQDQGVTGRLQNFIVEPFYQHTSEFYLAIKSERTYNKIFFSTHGGIDIEENWGKVLEFQAGNFLEAEPLETNLQKQISQNISDMNVRNIIIPFISAIYQLFVLLDFTYLEINPLIVENGRVIMLDLVARLDDSALFAKKHLWEQTDKIEFPAVFGSSRTEAEKQIQALDEKTGASLKFKVLNPNGRIWLLTSGGGSSIIFADTVGDLGFQKELANYGEYSGNPNIDETYAYANIIITQMLKSTAKNKILFIAGGIANFTDIRNTFIGIVKALKNHVRQLKMQKVTTYVRRGGPNYKAGLAYIKKELGKSGLFVEVHGPEMYMTEIINLALAENK
ncbi:MAG TPA: ATP citrate lyase citrate-binding domain-containing protein [Candidatus Dojkabacteria bacterium]|nr:ATP citrate lyase citrate-binding domain-containing protein [Candidatus Dojkabacteria bacterium]